MSSAIVKAFSVYERRFPASQGADAREYRAEQIDRWQIIFNHINHDVRSAGFDSELSRDLRSIYDMLRAHADDLAKITQEDDGEWTVSSDIALLESPHEFVGLMHCDRQELIGAVTLELTRGLGKIPGLVPELRNLKVLSTFYYLSLQMRYAAEKAAYHVDATQLAEKIAARSERLLDALTEHLKVYREGTEINAEKHRNDLEAFARERKAAIDDIAKSTNDRVDAIIVARQELDKIRKPVQLWSDAARSHKKSFWFGLGGLLSAIVGVAIGVVEYINPALNNLGFVKDNTAQPFSPASTLTLAAMVALVAAAGFVLKIAGRYVTNALTLAEDAQVRAALADTFIGLTAEETKATDEARNQARTVMLAALFRPLPGHQQEDITAPTVLSLAQDLLKKPG